jgi:hypothetical protein
LKRLAKQTLHLHLASPSAQLDLLFQEPRKTAAMSFLKKFDKLKDKFLGDDDKKEGHGEGASQPLPPLLSSVKQ